MTSQKFKKNYDKIEWTSKGKPFPRISHGKSMKHNYNIIHDIEPYQSMITGEWITSRSHHRDHLRQHGCIEVGNEKFPERKQWEPPPATEDIKRTIEELRSK